MLKGLKINYLRDRINGSARASDHGPNNGLAEWGQALSRLNKQCSRYQCGAYPHLTSVFYQHPRDLFGHSVSKCAAAYLVAVLVAVEMLGAANGCSLYLQTSATRRVVESEHRHAQRA